MSERNPETSRPSEDAGGPFLMNPSNESWIEISASEEDAETYGRPTIQGKRISHHFSTLKSATERKSVPEVPNRTIIILDDPLSPEPKKAETDLTEPEATSMAHNQTHVENYREH